MSRRRNSNRRRRRGGLGFLYKLLSVLVICGAVVLALTLFFRVDTVAVTGQGRYTEAEVIAATGVASGDNLFLMNKYDVAQNIVQALPYIEEIRINRRLPDTLLVEVKECETPLAVVQDGFAWLISPHGKIVDQQPVTAAEAYATIQGAQMLSPSVGTMLALSTEDAIQQQSLLDLLAALEEVALLDQVETIYIDDPALLTMDYAGRFTVELPYSADYPRKLSILRQAVDQLETNQTGTLQLTWEDEWLANFIPGTREKSG